MSDSNRSVALESIIYIFAGLSAFGLLMFVWFQGYSLGEEQGNSHYSAEYHEKYAADRIERECFPRNISGLKLDECIQKEIEASQERDNAQSDLDAQSRMAWWSVVVGTFTGLSVLVTGVGVVFLYRTLSATEEMVDQAQKATTAAYAAVDATREIGHNQSRAYVHAESAMLYWRSKTGEHPEITINVENFGQSPAKWFSTMTRTVCEPLSNEGAVEYPKQFSEVDFAGRTPTRWQAIAGNKICSALHPDDTAVVASAFQGQSSVAITVFGLVQYETIFGEVFETQFCFFLRPPFKFDTETISETDTVEMGGLMNVKNRIIRENGQKMSSPPIKLETYKKI